MRLRYASGGDSWRWGSGNVCSAAARFEVRGSRFEGFASSGFVFVRHVEEAEARQRVRLEQAFLQELLLHLLDLDRLHLAAIGREFARGLLAERDELVFGRRGEQGGEELFFEDREGAVG